MIRYLRFLQLVSVGVVAFVVVLIVFLLGVRFGFEYTCPFVELDLLRSSSAVLFPSGPEPFPGVVPPAVEKDGQ